MTARSPGFALVAVFTLGAALALCLTVSRVTNAYLIRSLPYPGVGSLYSLDLRIRGRELPRGLEAIDWSGLDDIIAHRIAWDLDVFYLLGGAYPESTPGAWITPAFVPGLGVRVEHGRLLDESDFVSRGLPPVLISHRLWVDRFGRDPSIVGRNLRAYVSDRPDEPETLTVVGVLSADFWHVNPYTEILAPLRAPSYPYLVKLREGVVRQLAADRITALVRSSATSVPDDWRAALVSIQTRYVSEMRPLLGAVGASASMVLLIACANVAVLLLVRATRRRHEVAVRLALGASRARLARVFALEALLLAALATALGLTVSVMVAYGLAPTLEQHLGRRLPGGASALRLDGTVAAAAMASGVVVMLALTMASLVALWWAPMRPGLETSSRGATDNPTGSRLRSVLITCEVAGALTLLAGSGLMIETILRLLRVDLGFRATGVMTSSVDLRQRSYPDGASRAAFYERLLGRLDEDPFLGPTAMSDAWVLHSMRPRRVESVDEPRTAAETAVAAVSASYFAALGIDFRDGRSFASEDRLGGEWVVVVSESLADRLWPGARAVGQRLHIFPSERQGGPTTLGRPHRVIGVVRDVRQVDTDDGRVRADVDPLDAYVPLLQDPGRFAYLYVPHRGIGLSAWTETAIRTVIAELDPEVAVGPPRALTAALDDVLARPRRMAWVFVAFAAFAVLLALLGVYSVVDYAVRQREREIGIRLVVGADRRAVTRLFVREGTPLVAYGLAAGLGGSMLLGRALQSQLFGVGPTEPRVLAATTLAFAICGGLALWWPARRAAAVDPARVLRAE